MQISQSYWRYFIVIILLGSLTSCMVGPDFHTPRAPATTRYTETRLPTKTASTPKAGKAGQSQYFVEKQDIPAEWWLVFHSPELNTLIRMGIDHSPNLTAAYATLRQAQETLNAQIGNSLFPAFGATLSAERQRLSDASFNNSAAISSSVFSLYGANVNVSYTLDLFGAARRQIEALGAQVDFQQFELIGAYLTLTANIATTAVTIAGLKAQIQATEQILKAQTDQLTILKKQWRLGGISQENVFTQQTLVEQTRAKLPPLQKNLAQNRHALAVLVGAYTDSRLPEINLTTLSLPTHLPVSLPSQLVKQRPDVRASEALLHAANAKIGVATANLFPQLTITGLYGWQSTVPSSLFTTKDYFWDILGNLTQPVFRGGALLAQRRQAIAAFDQAFAQYRQTVLQAFQNVADSLRAIETDARALRAQKAAEIAAFNSLRLARQQYQLGGANYLNLLNAQQQYQQTVVARIQAQAARYNDTVALFQSLGGGWWHKPWCVKECLP